ncbi:MAG: rod shape-determining protein MreD [Nitrospirota bacterium]|nr:rod shape-determining protein MreD [Nitrospirota bacterium]
MNRWSDWLLALVVAVSIIPLQLRILPILLPEVWIPHLGLVLVFVCGLALGEGVGVVAGFGLGLLYDRFTAGGVGLNLLLLPLVGAGAALLPRLLPEIAMPQKLILLGVFMLLAELFSAVMYSMAGFLVFDFWLVWHELIPAVLMNSLWGAVLLLYAGDDARGRQEI